MTRHDGSPVAFVTGADHGLGLALTEGLLARGWAVVAGRYGRSAAEAVEHSLASIEHQHGERLHVVPLDVSDAESVSAAADAVRHPRIDLVINNAGILGNEGIDRRIADGLDYASILETISVNALGSLRVVEALLRKTSDSSLKRLCFVSSEAGSITRCYRDSWYGYSMSKAALNMGVAVLFNELRPKGYTIRIYHPGWMQTFMSGQRNLEATLAPHEAAAHALRYFLGEEVDENRLMMRDYEGREWPW